MELPRPLAVLRGHEDSVNAVQFCKNDTLFSGSGDGLLKFWNITTRRCVNSVKGHDFSIQSLDTLNRNNSLISSGRDGLIKVWDIERLESIQSLHGCQHFCNISCDRNQVDGNLIAASSDCTFKVNLWDIRAPPDHPSLSLNCNTHGMVMSVLLSSSLQCVPGNCSIDSLSNLSLLIGSEDGTVSVVDIRQSSIIGELKSHSQPVFALDVSPSGSRIVTGAADNEVIMSECNREMQSFVQRTQQFALLEGGTSSIRYRSDGRLIASTHWDSSIRLFDKKLKPLAILRHHRNAVNCVRFNDTALSDVDKCQFATGSKDGTIALWSVYSHTYKAAPY